MRHYLKKIVDAEFVNAPFKHLYIENFFDREDFDLLQQCKLNRLPPYDNTAALIDGLRSNHYNPIDFPGCVKDINQYISSYQSGMFDGRDPEHETVVESYGMAFKQDVDNNPVARVRQLMSFMNSREFHVIVKHKFDLFGRPTRLSSTIQKYLSGYEISPHPDIRPKALTFLININPYDHMDQQDIHTHILQFKPEYKYVQHYWETHSVERDWVPWSWCNTVKVASENNSLLMFSPSCDTLHAVKLNYDHLKWQRTQIYGNLWYDDNQPRMPKMYYRDIPNEQTRLDSCKADSTN